MIVFILVPKNSGLQKYIDLALSSINKKNSKTIKARGEDIPFLVEVLQKQGKEVMGFTGEDLYKEYCLGVEKTNTKIIKRILWSDSDAVFGKPALSLLGPENKKLKDLSRNLSVCISSSYKNVSTNYLKELEGQGFNFEKTYLNGCVELAYSEDIADLIIDIVYTGSSMKKAGLKVFDKIMESDFLVIGGSFND